MEYKNYSNSISNDEMDKIIGNLSNKYKQLNIKIIILDNKYRSLIYFKILGFWQTVGIFKKYFLGWSSWNSNYIFIYPFNFHPVLHNKDDIIKAIFHEIRHQWQKQNNKIKFSNEKTIEFTYHEWKSLWTEKDAIGFSEEMLKKYNK